ncbi:MAG: hypothetical protein DRP18_00335 [Candidatus Aenigmatarchaeota archaeon]|nr:MAG: hypothetical protein DRP18_00335 [Candidatus Aenigmarchaeota archaeon]
MAGKQRKPRTSHISIFEQALKLPEVQNIIVTQREIGLMHRRMQSKYNRILSEAELERLVRIEKIKRLLG